MLRNTIRRRATLPVLINLLLALLFGCYYSYTRKRPEAEPKPLASPKPAFAGAILLANYNSTNYLANLSASQNTFYQRDIDGYSQLQYAAETCFWKIEDATLSIKEPYLLANDKIAYKEKILKIRKEDGAAIFAVIKSGNIFYGITDREWIVYEEQKPVRHIRTDKPLLPMRPLKNGEMLCFEWDDTPSGTGYVSRLTRSGELKRLVAIPSAMFCFNKDRFAWFDAYTQVHSLYFEEKQGDVLVTENVLSLKSRPENSSGQMFRLSADDSKIIITYGNNRKYFWGAYGDSYGQDGSNTYVFEASGTLLYKTTTSTTLLNQALVTP